MGRVVSPTPTPLSSGRVVPALVTSYDIHGRAAGLFYTQPTGQGGVHCIGEICHMFLFVCFILFVCFVLFVSLLVFTSRLCICISA